MTKGTATSARLRGDLDGRGGEADIMVEDRDGSDVPEADVGGDTALRADEDDTKGARCGVLNCERGRVKDCRLKRCGRTYLHQPQPI